MIVKLERHPSLKETEIRIKYANMSEEIERVVAMLQAVNTRIKCCFEGSEKFVSALDIYYFESVDKKTFVYCEQEVYKTEYRLYQIMEKLANLGFVQISKSCILNINMLDSLTPLVNSRMEATLLNGERLLVTRKYLEDIKQALQART